MTALFAVVKSNPSGLVTRSRASRARSTDDAQHRAQESLDEALKSGG